MFLAYMQVIYAINAQKWHGITIPLPQPTLRRHRAVGVSGRCLLAPPLGWTVKILNRHIAGNSFIISRIVLLNMVELLVV